MRGSFYRALTAVGVGCLSQITWALDIKALSAVIMDEKTGKVVWSKDPDTPRYPASTTKIMTALLLIEHCKPTDIITAPPDIETIKEASLHLKPGEQLTAQDMLWGLLLRSANDGCVAVADHISGSVPEFAKLMNQRAKEIGCTHTNFHNPNGLNDSLHTISARDLALIAREAMKYPQFREVVAHRRHVISRSINTKDIYLKSKDKYLDMDPTADGIKTGWTIPAGQCFVGSATRNGHRMITVILKSTDWKKDNGDMLNWAFKAYDRRTAIKEGDKLRDVKILDGQTDSVAAVASKDVEQVFYRENPAQFTTSVAFDPGLKAPITAGQRLGYATFTDSDGYKAFVPVVASTPVLKKEPKRSWPYLFLLGGVGTGAYWVRKRKRRSSFYRKSRRF